MEKQKTDVKKKAGIEIIYEFKDSINTLTHWYGMYMNLITELKAKFQYKNITETQEAIKKMDTAEKQQIIQYCQEIRYNATICIIKYKSIYPSLKLREEKGIEHNYKKIKDNFLINLEDVFDLIVILNKVMTEDIIQELLSSYSNLINEIFENDNKEPIPNSSS